MAANNSNIPAYQPIDQAGQIIGGSFTATGFRQVTATDTVFTLPTPPAATRRAIIQAEAQAIRWRDDGTAPTAAIGMLVPVGGELRYDGAAMGSLRMIAAVAGAIVNISYYA